MDEFLLAKFMDKFGDTQQTLADALGISLSRLNAKIKECKGAQFWQNEIMFIKKRYSLTSDEINNIFFDY